MFFFPSHFLPWLRSCPLRKKNYEVSRMLLSSATRRLRVPGGKSSIPFLSLLYPSFLFLPFLFSSFLSYPFLTYFHSNDRSTILTRCEPKTRIDAFCFWSVEKRKRLIYVLIYVFRTVSCIIVIRLLYIKGMSRITLSIGNWSLDNFLLWENFEIFCLVAHNLQGYKLIVVTDSLVISILWSFFYKRPCIFWHVFTRYEL